MSNRKTINNELKLRPLIFGKYLILNIPAPIALLILVISLSLTFTVGIITGLLFFWVVFPSLYFIHREDSAALYVFLFSLSNKFGLFSSNSLCFVPHVYIDKGDSSFPLRHDFFVSSFNRDRS